LTNLQLFEQPQYKDVRGRVKVGEDEEKMRSTGGIGLFVKSFIRRIDEEFVL